MKKVVICGVHKNLFDFYNQYIINNLLECSNRFSTLIRVKYMIIYKITNKQTDKIYIGQTHRDINKYWGSGHYIENAIKKYGTDAFTKEILCYCSSQEELNEKEIFYINEFNCIWPNGYNLRDGGSRGKFSEITKQKIREATKRQFANPETRQRFCEAQKRRFARPEERAKLVERGKKNKVNSGCFKKGNVPWTKGKPMSEKQKEILLQSRKGLIPWNKGLKLGSMNEEHKLKISIANKGKKKSEEHSANISKGRKGIKFTEEHKRNIKIGKMKKKLLKSNNINL